ncbi:MAG: hypothetical protein WAM58_11790 [Candidatus Acidiferrum sp.]
MRSNSQENGIHHTVGGFFSIHGNYLFESVRSEVLITVVDRLGDTIRIENRQIAGAAFNGMPLVFRGFKDTARKGWRKTCGDR